MRDAVKVGLVAVALILIPVLSASAHVTVSTDNPEPAGFSVYTVRVPNESDSASTVRIEVQIPEGLEVSRYQPKPEWTLAWQQGRLVAEGGSIGPGEFEEFRFQARNPAAPTTLSFPAIQVYDDGETVRWSGEPGSDTPASVVKIAPISAESRVDIPVVVALVLGALGTLLGGAALLRRP